jgi:hypothetical protein
MTSLPEDLAESVTNLLASSDPLEVSAEEFLAARFDEGLAWLHFPVGCGGRDSYSDQETT